MSACRPTPQKPDASRNGSHAVAMPSSLAFLVHSQNTLSNNLPPDVDNKPLARQRRRRTSPEDQRILEEEFIRNPKPSRATRQEIADRVALGEKEVQIWFQNRRQNCRRRMQTPGTLSLSSQPPSSDPHTQDASPPFSSSAPAIFIQTDESLAKEREPTPLTSQASIDNGDLRTDCATQRADHIPRVDHATTTPESASEVVAEGLADAAGRSEQGLERLATVSAKPSEIAEEKTNGGINNCNPERRSLKRSASSLRLSLTLDGQATVTTEEEASQHASFPTAGSEYSELEPTLSQSLATSTTNSQPSFSMEDVRRQRPPPITTGRSRDSRTWEFWCDPESRNSLADKADQELTGSAANAIGLIRSNSRKALNSNQSKRNTFLSNLGGSVKRQRVKAKDRSTNKPKLSRAVSSYARLQGSSAANPPAVKPDFKKSKNLDEGMEPLDIPNNESDKENWEPSENGDARDSTVINTATAMATPQRADAWSRLEKTTRQILGENTTVMSESGSLGAMLDKTMTHSRRHKSRAKPRPRDSGAIMMSSPVDEASFDGEEKEDEEENSEGESPRTGFDSTSLSSGEDLDCVQGLLKLSQGNWK